MPTQMRPDYPRMSPQEYFEFEAQSLEKHEYWDGMVVPVGGPYPEPVFVGTARRSQLAQRLRTLLNEVVSARQDATVFDSRIAVSTAAGTHRPDATVVLGPPQFNASGTSDATLLNPSVLVDVMCGLNEQAKWAQPLWRVDEVPGLQTHVLVEQAQRRVRITQRRSEQEWLVQMIDDPTGNVWIEPLQAALRLSDIYAGFNFGDAPDLTLPA